MNKRVLVVDDEEIVRMSVLRTLGPRGYEVQTVDNGFEALEILRDSEFDLVITDFKMPDMDGLEFIHMLRRTAPAMTRILLVTGYATEEAREHAVALGASYLPKPFKPDELIGAIENL